MINGLSSLRERGESRVVSRQIMVIEEVFKTVDNNFNLSPKIKNEIKELLIIYVSNNPRVDLGTINTNLTNLKFTECNKYFIKDPLKYVNFDKTIYINTSESNKDYDYKYLLMRELMLMQTYKNDISKMRQMHLNSIYEGYASISANNYIGNNGNYNPYEDEIIIVNLLGKIVGFESIEELFNNNNQELLMDNLAKMGNSIDDVKSITNLMNYNSNIKENPRGKSMLKEVQLKLIKMFVKKGELTNDDIDKFRSLLFGNEVVFEQEVDKYKDINQVYKFFDEIVSNFELKETVVKGR